MSANEIVLQQLDEGLLTITMNRPERRNALNADMTLGLVEAARRAAEDHEVRAVLLKGAGGTFCVGGDVKSMAEGRAPLAFEAKMTNLRRGMEVSRILHQMPKPVVAQLDGAAAGAGLSIALACDLRVASASCKITTAFAKVGFSGDYGGTYFLTHLLGSAKARELYLLSPVLSAQEAFALGMVTKVVGDAEVEAAAHELATSVTGMATSPNAAFRTRCCRLIPSSWKWSHRFAQTPRRGALSKKPAAAAATWRSSAATIPTRAASTPTRSACVPQT